LAKFGFSVPIDRPTISSDIDLKCSDLGSSSAGFMDHICFGSLNFPTSSDIILEGAVFLGSDYSAWLAEIKHLLLHILDLHQARYSEIQIKEALKISWAPPSKAIFCFLKLCR
jgi:hypothetical protein